jgi:hypothetical protein
VSLSFLLNQQLDLAVLQELQNQLPSSRAAEPALLPHELQQNQISFLLPHESQIDAKSDLHQINVAANTFS